MGRIQLTSGVKIFHQVSGMCSAYAVSALYMPTPLEMLRRPQIFPALLSSCSSDSGSTDILMLKSRAPGLCLAMLCACPHGTSHPSGTWRACLQAPRRVSALVWQPDFGYGIGKSPPQPPHICAGCHFLMGLAITSSRRECVLGRGTSVLGEVPRLGDFSSLW